MSEKLTFEPHSIVMGSVNDSPCLVDTLRRRYATLPTEYKTLETANQGIVAILQRHGDQRTVWVEDMSWLDFGTNWILVDETL